MDLHTYVGMYVQPTGCIWSAVNLKVVCSILKRVLGSGEIYIDAWRASDRICVTPLSSIHLPRCVALLPYILQPIGLVRFRFQEKCYKLLWSFFKKAIIEKSYKYKKSYKYDWSDYSGASSAKNCEINIPPW